MKGKLLFVIIGILLIVFLPMLVNAQTDTRIWYNDLNYSNTNDLETAGWTTTHSSGITFTSNGIILDGSNSDTAIHYRGITNGTSNWAVETKSRWLGTGHSGSSVCIVTEDHIYGFMPDGYYDNFAFYYDCVKVKTFDGYQESVNTWMTLKLEKYGSTIEMFYNDQLIGTYTTDDTSKVVGTDYVSPWKGNAEYDYIQIWSVSGFSSSSGNDGSSASSVFSNPLVIGGAVGAVGVGVGVAVYYFFIAGGSEAAASAASSSAAASASAGSAGGSGGGSTGGGSLIHHPTSESVEASVSGSVNDNLFADATSQIQQQMSTSPLSGEAIPTNQATPNSTVNPYKIQQDAQTHEFQTQQDVTVNQSKTLDKMFNKWDEYIFGSTDVDTTVADGGSGSGSNEG